MNKYTVYKHVSPDGRVYIGITGRKPMERWQCGHGYARNTYFTRAINKYGWENFTHEILFEGLTREEAISKEVELIAEYRSNERQFGFNISSGGESKTGTVISDWHRSQISKANRGKTVSAETREKLRKSTKNMWSNPEYVKHMREINLGENNPVYGRHIPDEEKVSRGAKAISQYSLDGEFICNHVSSREAEKASGVARANIVKCCKGKYKQSGGYVWKYSA